jgi:predicted nucleic acid-binding protein
LTILVVDASMIGAALFPSQYLHGAEAVVRGGAGSVWAPQLLTQEVTNSAWKLERRGLLTRDDVDSVLARFARLGIELVDSPGSPRRALAIARRFTQSRIFDAIYLACAEDLDAELWTCDRRFVASFGNHRPSCLRLCPDDVGSDR